MAKTYKGLMQPGRMGTARYWIKIIGAFTNLQTITVSAKWNAVHTNHTGQGYVRTGSTVTELCLVFEFLSFLVSTIVRLYFYACVGDFINFILSSWDIQVSFWMNHFCPFPF